MKRKFKNKNVVNFRPPPRLCSRPQPPCLSPQPSRPRPQHPRPQPPPPPTTTPPRPGRPTSTTRPRPPPGPPWAPTPTLKKNQSEGNSQRNVFESILPGS